MQVQLYRTTAAVLHAVSLLVEGVQGTLLKSRLPEAVQTQSMTGLPGSQANA
jgi:hypothetical protein